MLSGRSSEYAAVKESFDEKYKRQQAVIQPLQPSALIAALERAASQADKDSDQVGTSTITLTLCVPS